MYKPLQIGKFEQLVGFRLTEVFGITGSGLCDKTG